MTQTSSEAADDFSKWEISVTDILLICRDLYSGAPDPIVYPLPVRAFISPNISSHIPAENGAYKINIEAKSWRTKQLNGALFRYKDHADIIYSLDLNVCWRRFVACKELIHLLMDSKDKHFCTDPLALVQGLITGVPVQDHQGAYDSERLAICGAMELLLPWRLRDEMDKQMAAGRSDYDMALAFRVPEKVVNLRLKSAFGRWLDQIHRALDGR